MDLSLTTEQRLLQDTLERCVRDYRHGPTSTAGLAWAVPQGQELWRRLIGELGLGLLVPKAGGEPLHVEHALVLEVFGRHLLREPFLESVVVAGHLLAALGGERAETLLDEISAAEAIAVLAWAEPQSSHDFADLALLASRDNNGWTLDGRKCLVRSAACASHFLVVARTSGRPGDAQGLSLFLLPKDTPGLSLNEYPCVDGGHAADLQLDRVRLDASALLGEEGAVFSHLERLRDIAVAGACAQARGLLGEMLEQTRAHVGQRRQFGQSLAGFQVVQHRLVDMYLHVLKAGSASLLATPSLDTPGSGQAASAAQVVMASACRFVGQSAVQLHGGMGMSNEIAISHYFRRATALEREFGSRDFHLVRYNALQPLAP
ncbi:acyl-CoA dehydrogenase family protein [Pseudomonas sp. Marseille-P9899]|uniref:acyl-CoA dehydrogenase family protein n=1 Tax=Pseudomonas sp. Marseille-P9899 TaxID=2730401 RepID=UPI0015890055|nr:acyl-CoA dehydrogenase family protein [Pseudomonas sp. Marseille-P9899]